MFLIDGINSFGAILLDRAKILTLKEDTDSKRNNKLEQHIISFIPNDYITIKIDRNTTKRELKSIYLKKISCANIKIILKVFLLIFSGSLITTNLLLGVFNIARNFSNFLICLIIYYCYSYIIRYIYTPMGKQRIIASYLFPFYFVMYIIITIYNFITISIKKA